MVFLQVIAAILYFGLGLLQLSATFAGLEGWLGLHWIIAGPIAFFLAYVPLVGTIVGIFGAVTAWGWSWLEAGALFFGPFAVILILALISGGVEAIINRKGANA
jgi:hypothetical protein